MPTVATHQALKSREDAMGGEGRPDAKMLCQVTHQPRNDQGGARSDRASDPETAAHSKRGAVADVVGI